MHLFFDQNPEFLEFCNYNNITEEVSKWLDNPTAQNFAKIEEIIKKAEFSSKQAQRLYPKPVIIGNGDVDNYEQGLELCDQYGTDGIMIGRGIFRDPFAFLTHDQKLLCDTQENRIKLLIEHITNWDLTWNESTHPKHFPTVRKFVKMYISGFSGAVELRARLMETKTPQELIEMCKKELNQNII
jgi:tRNA-dihydrouridine synthase